MIRTAVVALNLEMAPALPHVVETSWRSQLPTLSADGITLRELRLSDAAETAYHILEYLAANGRVQAAPGAGPGQTTFRKA